MPESTLTCKHCFAPYTNIDRGCCSICLTMQWINISAILALPPGAPNR